MVDLLVGVGGCISFFVGGPIAFIVGGILLQLFEILDCVDGEMARYLKHYGVLQRTHAQELIVEFVQDMVHPILHPVIFFGWSYGLFVQHQSHSLLILGYIAALGMSLDTYTNTLREKLLLAPGLQASRVYKEIEASARSRLQRIPFGRYLLKLVVFVVPIPGVVTILLIAAIIDAVLFHFMSPRIIFGLPLNAATGALVFYAAIQPLLWIINAWGSVSLLRRTMVPSKFKV